MCDYGWNGSNVGIELEEMRKAKEPRISKEKEAWSKLESTGMAWEFFPEGFSGFKKWYKEHY